MQKEKIKLFENFNEKPGKGKKALLVSNGRIKDFISTAEIIKKYYGYTSDDFVIAADGGALNCINLKIAPDLIIGDMDSITTSVLSRLNTTSGDLKFINCSHDKDESDTQLALDYLKNKGYKKILIAGALGNRVDHSLANLALITSGEYDDMDIRITAEDSEIFAAKGPCKIKGAAGKRISILSITPYTFFEKTSGLKYRLKNEKLLFSPVRGLSNEFIKDTVKLDFYDGILLIFKEI